MPLGTQPYYRPALPANTSPSGRKIDPRTGIIGSMPGGMDFLAGFGPAPAGVNLPDLAPVVHPGILGGAGSHQQSFMDALARFRPSANRPATPYTPINPYATPAANVAGGQAIQAAAPQTPWWQTPGLFGPGSAAGAPAAPTIQWAGSGMPYGQMNDAYKSLTAGLNPAQILNMFPAPKKA